jgi:hypothetical protein
MILIGVQIALFVIGVKVVIQGLWTFFFYERFSSIEFFMEHKNADTARPYPRPKLEQFLLHPTIYCNVCMSSFWCTICYWAILGGAMWNEWIYGCVISAGLIYIYNLIRENYLND